MPEPDPALRPEAQPAEPDRALRPNSLAEFIGQRETRANLRIFVESARMRNAAMDHILFSGPPGLGKTTLAQILARELGVDFRMTSGPVLAKAGDLAAILTNVERHNVLFIDEIHRLHPLVEEILYPALEDYALDLVIGSGPAARTVRDQSSGIHPDRGDDPARTPDHAASGQVRHSGPSGILQDRGAV